MRKIGLTLSAGVAVALLAACSSSSTTTTGPKSGTETISGSTTSVANNVTIPLTASGVVSATNGKLPTGGPNNGTDTLTFKQGGLTVHHVQSSSKMHFDKTACSFTGGASGKYTVKGGTGVFKGATGNGVFTVTFSGKFALTDGKCKAGNSTKPTSALTSFKATGPLSVPQ